MDKLVDYSSSSSSSETELTPKKKKKKLLPMPFVKPPSNKINNINRDGRKRQIEHIDGNWPSLIFIEPEDNILSNILIIVRDIEEKFKDIKAVESPHVSLSKLFILKHHWIDNFHKILSTNVSFESFIIELSPQIVFLCNDDKSRHFACLLIEESCKDTLKSLVNQIDKSLKEFQLPSYYKDSIFHLSFLWKLSEFNVDEKRAIEDGVRFLMKENTWEMIVTKITLKTGNKIKFLHSFSS